MTYTKTNDSGSWVAKIGNLKPWELTNARLMIGDLSPAELSTLLTAIANCINRRLIDPIDAANVETILLMAADISGIFAGIEGARAAAKQVSPPSLAWSLVLGALEGASYEDLIDHATSRTPDLVGTKPVILKKTGARRYGIHKNERISSHKPMNISRLAGVVAAQDGRISKARAKDIVESVFGSIKDAAEKGEEVSLAGFGKFKIKRHPEKVGRNPSTGALLKIEPSKKIAFKPAKALRDAMKS